MFAKLNDNTAALVFSIYLLGIIAYVVQLIFMTGSWLANEGFDASAVPVARVLGATWLGLGVGLLFMLLKGPDGQSSFFIGIIVAQVATLLVILHSYFILKIPTSGDDSIIVAVLTLLLIFGWYRIKDRV